MMGRAGKTIHEMWSRQVNLLGENDAYNGIHYTYNEIDRCAASLAARIGKGQTEQSHIGIGATATVVIIQTKMLGMF